jgi:hypothetical protein
VNFEIQKLIETTFENLNPSSRKTECVFITKTNRLIFHITLFIDRSQHNARRFRSHHLCIAGLFILICYKFMSIKDHHQTNTHY